VKPQLRQILFPGRGGAGSMPCRVDISAIVPRPTMDRGFEMQPRSGDNHNRTFRAPCAQPIPLISTTFFGRPGGLADSIVFER